MAEVAQLAQVPEGEPGFPPVTSKYEALGLALPDPATMCHRCDGVGVLPVYQSRGDMRPLGVDGRPRVCTPDREPNDPVLVAAWEADEAIEACGDGWQFIVCPECGGTRLRPHRTTQDPVPAQL